MATTSKLILVANSLLVLLTLAACAPASAPPPAGAPPSRPQVEMPYGGRGVAGLVHYTAVEDGYYAKHGVDVSSSNVGSTPTLVAAVLSGDAPIGATGQEAVINAAVSGGDVVIIAAQLHAIASSVIGPWSTGRARDAARNSADCA